MFIYLLKKKKKGKVRVNEWGLVFPFKSRSIWVNAFCCVYYIEIHMNIYIYIYIFWISKPEIHLKRGKKPHNIQVVYKTAKASKTKNQERLTTP